MFDLQNILSKCDFILTYIMYHQDAVRNLHFFYLLLKKATAVAETSNTIFLASINFFYISFYIPRHYVCFHLKYASSNFSRQQTWRVNTKRLMHDYVSGSQFTTRPLSWEIFLNLWHLHVVFTRMFFSSLLVWEFVAWYIVVKTLFDPGPLGIVCLLPSQQPVLKSKLKSCRPQLFSVMKLFSLSEFFSRDVNRNGEFSFMFPVWIHI